MTAIQSPFQTGGGTASLDWLNVTSLPYKADKTGVADSTAGINAAIAAAVAAGGGVVYLPAGTYKISAALTCSGKNVTLLGDGSGDSFAANLTRINQTSTTANGFTASDGDNIIIKGIAFTGPGSGSGKGISNGSSSLPTQFSLLEDVVVRAFGGDGIYFQQPILTSLTNVWAADNGGFGFNLDGLGTSVSANSCWARNNSGGGWRVTGNYHCFSGCAADINTGVGWTLNGCQSVAMDGCGSELNTGNAFWVTNSCLGVAINGCWALNTAIGLLIDANCFGTVVSGFTEAGSGAPTASIQAGAGATVTVIQPNVATAVNYLSGGSFINQILSGAIDPGGPVAMGSSKITGLANGSAASDAAAFGQTPAGGSGTPMTTRGDLLTMNSTPAPSRLAVGAVNTMLQSNGTAPSWALGLVLQAATAAAGYTKVNGTGNVITWTTPNDGALHRVLLMYSQHVTSTETGGQMQITTTTPDGGSHGYTIETGGAGNGFSQGSNTTYMVEAGTSVTVSQSSALTAGASVFWAEIWGS